MLEYFWRFCNPKFKSGKTRKSGLVAKSQQEKLADLFLVFPVKHNQKRFIRIFSLNVPEIRSSALFSQFYQTVTMETMTIIKILTSVLAIYFQSSIPVQRFITIKWQGKKLLMIKVFTFFLPDHLNLFKPAVKFVSVLREIDLTNEPEMSKRVI